MMLSVVGSKSAESTTSGGSRCREAVGFDDVAIAFGVAGRRTFRAIEGITLTIGAGEFVAIVGPTGCGKSTLLNAAAGLLNPAAGRVSVFGAPLDGLNGDAGYLFQQEALMPWKTAVENVTIGLETAGTPRRAARTAAHGWLSRMGLGSFAERYPHMLSGGQRKRVMMAQVLIRDPRIILMDEPFGSLDAQTRLIMGDLLLRLWSENRKAVLFVTHDLEEAISLADRVVIMSAGPAARIIGDFPIGLERPRTISEIKLIPDFQTLHRDIWHLLKAEVLRAYPDMPMGKQE